MTDDRELAAKAVDQDLLAPDVLFRPAEPMAPAGYELDRELGRGGSGTVWLAKDLTLARPVAIKFLHDASPADLARFRREARVTARLNNPAIVQIYELGQTESNPYIAMQFIDGQSLATAELDTRELVRVSRDVALALEHAHAQGIVHRDIKPENVLLDTNRRAYLTDFGIARSTNSGLDETISREGQIMGTPHLMAPEQARGDTQAVDARSDIYALGATLYTKLTGRYPFTASNVVDLLHAVIHDQPKLPRAIDATIPRAIEAIVMRCMEKAREDRYQNMREVASELEHVVSGTAVQGDSTAWFRRLVGKVVGVAEPPPVDDRAADPYWSRGLEIVGRIAAWDTDLYRVSGSLARSFQRLDTIRAELDAILADRPDTAWARFYRGVALFRQGRLQDAREDMERSIERVKDLAAAYFELGRLYLALALAAHSTAFDHISETGRWQELDSVHALLDQALVALREADRLQGEVPPWHRGYTDAVQKLSEADYAGCIAACDVVLEQDPDVEQVWKLRGDAERLSGQEPFASYDRALEVRRSYYEALYTKAQAYLDRGNVSDARTALERALVIHPQFVEAQALLARVHLRDESYEQSIAIAEQAWARYPASYAAAVALAEARLEAGRRSEDGRELLSAARDALDAAAELPGCQHRVKLLRMMTQAELARVARAAGEDVRPQLLEVREFCREHLRVDPDHEGWMRLLESTERELGTL